MSVSVKMVGKLYIFLTFDIMLKCLDMLQYKGQCVRDRTHVYPVAGSDCRQSQSCQSRDINYVCVGASPEPEPGSNTNNNINNVGSCQCRDDMRVNQWQV